MNKLRTALTIALATSICAASPIIAQAQSVRVEDISVQLQAGLEANAPTAVYFGFDSDKLSPEAQGILQQQAAWLVQNVEAKVDLAGHTDAVGSNEYNDNLAMRRATAVNDYMLSYGVNQEQMRSVVSRGEAELAVSTQKRERLNRRVTTRVTGLAEYAVASQPVYVPPPPPAAPAPVSRTYASGNGPVCDGRSRTPLMDMSDMKGLRAELASRMNTAASQYINPAVLASTGPDFGVAAYTKVQCGIAIGYTKKGILDERSVSNCDCGSNQLAMNRG